MNSDGILSKEEFIALKEQEALPDNVVADVEKMLGIRLGDAERGKLRSLYLNFVIDELPQQKWGKRLRQRQEKLHQDIAAAYDKLANLLEQERRGALPTRPVETTLLFKVGVSGRFPGWGVFDELVRCQQLAELARSRPEKISQERDDTRHKTNLNTFIERFAELASESGHRPRGGTNRKTDQREITPFVKATARLINLVPLSAVKACGIRVSATSETTESAVAERIHKHKLLRNVRGRRSTSLAR